MMKQSIHALIAGALFDFMGHLTCREERLTLSSRDLATPAVAALGEWAKKRGLDLNVADVPDWHNALVAPSLPAGDGLTDERQLDLYDEIECDLPALFGRASLEGHESGQRLAKQVQDKMRVARAQYSAPAAYIQGDQLAHALKGAHLCRVEAKHREGFGMVPIWTAPRQPGEMGARVPDGWKLVPVEPTDAMTFVGQKHRYDSAWSIGAIYREMLAAAPRQPGEVGAGVPEDVTPDLNSKGVHEPTEGMYLSAEDVKFLATRLRRLFAHFDYQLPKFAEDSRHLIGIAPSCIGAVLANSAASAQQDEREAQMRDAAMRTVQAMGYTYSGGDRWRPQIFGQQVQADAGAVDTFARAKAIVETWPGWKREFTLTPYSPAAESDKRDTVAKMTEGAAFQQWACATGWSENAIGYSGAREVWARACEWQRSQQVTEDSAMLDWLVQHEAWIAWGQDGETCRVFHRDDDGDALPFMGWKCPRFDNARDAIRAAMSREQSGGDRG
jgi:hypothetical protein